ncbi:MAG: hypothetical protein GWM90_30755, partial [Gemmatimonadetes bacterium]|nr:hypothetical protein [Gemmatimonadota bacterium]NIQ59569.1 hypothetical protein [Gemmatimonadota bacterium]NIU79776.1 hypothetical protein [Gammaproteobacteria bacterium]NIX48285.1 hypothetical protein [Gemmatimonadota bacterium]NIY12727.1 hypothetical protein [Gemmatimonadota bacterium]
DVSFPDALEIYTRLLRLDEDESQNIRTRALAILGEKAEQTGDWPEAEPPEPATAEEESRSRSLFGQLKSRLRGRVKDDLRRRIEFIAARTEVALIGTHKENALHFVQFLADEGVGEQKAVELYLDALDVRESIAEVTYYLALSELADSVLPAHGSGLAAARKETGLPEREDASGRLHAVE